MNYDNNNDNNKNTGNDKIGYLIDNEIFYNEKIKRVNFICFFFICKIYFFTYNLLIFTYYFLKIEDSFDNISNLVFEKINGLDKINKEQIKIITIENLKLAINKLRKIKEEFMRDE
jgi:hypothetical protein